MQFLFFPCYILLKCNFLHVAVPPRKEVGIIDTHTHHNLRQIVENKPFPNIWRAEVLETRPVCDGRKILSEGSRFEVFDRIICKAVGNLVSSGQMTYNGGVRAVKALMYKNQMRLFNLKGEFNE